MATLIDVFWIYMFFCWLGLKLFHLAL